MPWLLCGSAHFCSQSLQQHNTNNMSAAVFSCEICFNFPLLRGGSWSWASLALYSSLYCLFLHLFDFQFIQRTAWLQLFLYYVGQHTVQVTHTCRGVSSFFSLRAGMELTPTPPPPPISINRSLPFAFGARKNFHPVAATKRLIPKKMRQTKGSAFTPPMQYDVLRCQRNPLPEHNAL